MNGFTFALDSVPTDTDRTTQTTTKPHLHQEHVQSQHRVVASCSTRHEWVHSTQYLEEMRVTTSELQKNKPDTQPLGKASTEALTKAKREDQQKP
jgi:hypothetical protein